MEKKKKEKRRQWELVNRAVPERGQGAPPAVWKEMCQHAHNFALLSPLLGCTHTQSFRSTFFFFFPPPAQSDPAGVFPTFSTHIPPTLWPCSVAPCPWQQPPPRVLSSVTAVPRLPVPVGGDNQCICREAFFPFCCIRCVSKGGQLGVSHLAGTPEPQRAELMCL